MAMIRIFAFEVSDIGKLTPLGFFDLLFLRNSLFAQRGSCFFFFSDLSVEVHTCCLCTTRKGELPTSVDSPSTINIFFTSSNFPSVLYFLVHEVQNTMLVCYNTSMGLVLQLEAACIKLNVLLTPRHGNVDWHEQKSHLRVSLPHWQKVLREKTNSCPCT